MNCPTEDDLMRYLDDVLDEERKAGVAEHVAGCDRCRSLLERLSREDEAFVTTFRRSFDTPIGDADEERIVTSLLTLHRIRRSERKPGGPFGPGDDRPEPA